MTNNSDDKICLKSDHLYDDSTEEEDELAAYITGFQSACLTTMPLTPQRLDNSESSAKQPNKGRKSKNTNKNDTSISAGKAGTTKRATKRAKVEEKAGSEKKARGRLKNSANTRTKKNKSTENLNSDDLKCEIKLEPQDLSEEFYNESHWKNLTLLSNVNQSLNPELRVVFMGHDKTETGQTEMWLDLIMKQQCNSEFTRYQCSFCPYANSIPNIVADHMKAEHSGLEFALVKRKILPSASFVYRFCRHCDFVAISPLSMWIHFEVFHEVIGILDNGGQPVAVKAELDEEIRSMSDVELRKKPVAYVCCECDFLSDDRIKTSRHVVKEHSGTSACFNGCFVKLFEITRPQSIDTKPHRFSEIMKSPVLSSCCKKCLVCFVCGLALFSPCAALYHYLSSHHRLQLLQECYHTTPSYADDMELNVCTERFLNDSSLNKHLNSDLIHRSSNTCYVSVTIVEKNSSDMCQDNVTQKNSSDICQNNVMQNNLEVFSECSLRNRME